MNLIRKTETNLCLLKLVNTVLGNFILSTGAFRSSRVVGFDFSLMNSVGTLHFPDLVSNLILIGFESQEGRGNTKI